MTGQVVRLDFAALEARAQKQLDAALRADKTSEECWIAFGKTLEALKEAKPDDVTWPNYVHDTFGLSRARADELIRIGTGKTTVAEVRERARQSTARSKARAADSVSGSDEDPTEGLVETTTNSPQYCITGSATKLPPQFCILRDTDPVVIEMNRLWHAFCAHYQSATAAQRALFLLDGWPLPNVPALKKAEKEELLAQACAARDEVLALGGGGDDSAYVAAHDAVIAKRKKAPPQKRSPLLESALAEGK